MEIAPCIDKCPIGLPIQDYIRLTAEGRFEEAYSLIVKEAPIPSILGRICFHPCEDACRRKDVDASISICNIKRFLGDRIKNYELQITNYELQNKSKKIVVVGGGPAGLSCAWQLLQLGYRVDIFEEKESAGGMPYIVIPLWRLPQDILKKEITNLINAGLSIKTNKRFGDDFGLNNLKKEYDIVVIACGLPKSRGIKIIEGDDVLPALSFLEAIKSGVRRKRSGVWGLGSGVNFNKSISLGKRVLVIGGGNVAIDCARGALRMGRDVSLVCLEDYENMPSLLEEKRACEEEGVKILGGFGPKELLRENGKIKQLVVMKVLSLFDNNKRFSPTFKEDEIKTFDCDTIIMAIGQMADWETLKKGGITPDLLKEAGSTIPGLFGCGDIVQGPTNAASAIASGKRVAQAIHCYLKSEIGNWKLEIGNQKMYNPILPFPKETIPLIAKRERIKPESLGIKERICSFREIEKTYTLTDVFCETSRCLYCGKGPEQKKEICSLCLTCIRICPLKGIKIEGKRAMPSSDTCQSCGICAGFCPDNAISFSGLGVRGSGLVKILHSPFPIPQSPIPNSDFGFLAFASERTRIADFKTINELEISCFDNPSSDGLRVRCLLSVGIPFLLCLMEKGLEKLLIKPCPNECFVPSAKPYVGKMLNRLKKILKEIGYKEDRLEFNFV